MCFVAAKMPSINLNIKDMSLQVRYIREKDSETINNSMSKNAVKIISMVCKDTCYGFLKKILIKIQDDEMLSEEFILLFTEKMIKNSYFYWNN